MSEKEETTKGIERNRRMKGRKMKVCRSIGPV